MNSPLRSALSLFVIAALPSSACLAANGASSPSSAAHGAAAVATVPACRP
jgi:hypothetical protein